MSRPIRVADLEKHRNAIGVCLYCPKCQSTYSANPNDYWNTSKDFVFKCCGVNNKLVVKQTRIVEVENKSDKAPRSAGAQCIGRHAFTELAPEVTDTGDPEDAEMFRWCIRCGALKLGSRTFFPGPAQKKYLVEEER